LNEHGHAFVKAGIRTDETLRPRGWQNLYVCGKLLAGYDPYAEGSGGGVAVATGWRAGMLAGGAVR
jgi:glycerol-3-phosphate dehydrogenase subunit B